MFFEYTLGIAVSSWESVFMYLKSLVGMIISRNELMVETLLFQ